MKNLFSPEEVVIVTGSSKGIGTATARMIAADGARVVVHGRTESDELKAIRDELDAECVVCDIGDEQAVKTEFAKVLAKFGRVDALVNCAGVPKVVPFMESTEKDWLDVYRVNVLGTVFPCQAVIPMMQKQDWGGRIVNIGSVRGHDLGAGIFNGLYSQTKAAVKNISFSMAKQFAPKIRVNCVSPGFTETSFAKTWNDKIWAQINSVLVGRIGQSEEVASLICYLASVDSSFVTGQDFVIDGGLLASGIK